MRKDARKIKTGKTHTSLNPFLDFNRNVEALAAHLCAYANVLKQCSSKPLQG